MYFSAPLKERLIPFKYYMTKDDIYGRLLTYSQFAVLRGDDLQVSRLLVSPLDLRIGSYYSFLTAAVQGKG